MAKTINLFYAGHGPVIGKMRVDETIAKTVTNDDVLTVIILDVSGSMSSYVKSIVEQHLPNALKTLDMDTQPITLIAFCNIAKKYTCTADTMKTLGICAGGQTCMSTSIPILRDTITASGKTNIRILTISDGVLDDQTTTITQATSLAQLLDGKYNIRSSAIRLFTSSSQPDTRGLASILQLHTDGVSKLIDFRCSMSSDFVSMFADSLRDDLSQTIKMKSTKPIFMSNPWSAPSTELNLSKGDNTFWLTPDADALISLNDEHVNLDDMSAMNFSNFETVMRTKIEFYINRLKVLKVINTATSKTEVENIKKYFDSIQAAFEIADRAETIDSAESGNTLNARIKYFKKKHMRESKSLLQDISTIANQDFVSQLNSLQQADYLRNVETSSNTINLAKRGAKMGLDFDAEAIREVKNMAAHLSELDDVNDAGHAVSFYSQETTLGGIKALCGLVEDDSIDQMSALEILHILNIVGIPADAIIGDFPDPKTYHIKNFLLGDCISMSDILTGRQMGSELEDPFSKKPIKNAIPFYDDDRIQQFLIKYAPTLLEYTASLGMRGMIINIPTTYMYTIVDGLWRTIREVQESPTEGNINLFVKFVHTYKTAVGTHFDYVVDLIKPMSPEDKEQNLSFYIANNGITNMIGPLIAIHDHPEKMSLVPDILRALYTFEYYQVLKKYYKTDSDGYIKRKQFLHDLIGIDLTKYASPLPPLFESQDEPAHHDECHVNQTMFDTTDATTYWINYVCLAPTMIGHALKNDLTALKSMDYSKSSYEAALNITFPLSKFKLSCMVQGMMYDTLASRYNDTLHKMKIEDAGNEVRTDTFLANYIREQYAQDYKVRLDAQHKIEIEKATKRLIKQMILSDDINEFIKLFKDGLTINHVTVVITDVFKPGFELLKSTLFKHSEKIPDVPLRGEKFRILALGQDRDGNIVYNKGNTLGMNPYKLEAVFIEWGLAAMWTEIKDKYIDKNVHLYRAPDIPNHRGHSNSKPSFGAYGFKNLREYRDNITPQQFDEYCKIHTHCCGIWDGVPAKWS